jgi:hypothetical protein
VREPRARGPGRPPAARNREGLASWRAARVRPIVSASSWAASAPGPSPSCPFGGPNTREHDADGVLLSVGRVEGSEAAEYSEALAIGLKRPTTSPRLTAVPDLWEHWTLADV